MLASRELLRSFGLPAFDSGPPYALSQSTFETGERFRIEIPEVENPEVFHATLEAAERAHVRVHRVSQGTGITLLSKTELREMAQLEKQSGAAVFLFVGARATHDIGAQAYSPLGAGIGRRLRGIEGLAHGLSDVLRAVECGIRGILAADEGLIMMLNELRQRGELPADLRIKSSAAIPATNPMACRLLQNIGVNSINLPTDLTVGMVAAIRSCVQVPIDFYVEAPPGLGGFVRYHELPDLVRCGSPIHLKFGLRNEVDTDPWGAHLREAALNQARERVHRAALALELLDDDAGRTS